MIPEVNPLKRNSLQAIVQWRKQVVTIGADAPIRVQAMTNTNTEDIHATVAQVRELFLAGSELVRLTVNTPAAAKAIPYIRELLDREDIDVPLIGDFHYNGHKLLSEYSDCARMLSKYRINPGNVGKGERHDVQFAQMIEIAMRHHKPVRIGVNWGSLDQELLAAMMDENNRNQTPLSQQQIMYQAVVASALQSSQAAEQMGMDPSQIVISCKMSHVCDLISVYQELAKRCKNPLHLGLTEAGMGVRGIVASVSALAPLLLQGIGDTIRISLTPEPGGSRTQEVIVAQELLQSLRLRHYVPSVTACPGCGRTSSTLFQEMAQRIDQFLREKMPTWRLQYPGVEALKVAVMGCIVNGPGESRHADIGISLPGYGESPSAPVFIDGERVLTLKGEEMTQEFLVILENYVKRRYGSSGKE